MTYGHSAIGPEEIPAAAVPWVEHVLETYASETNKTHSVWVSFGAGDLEFRPHEKSSTVGDVMRHQLLSERRFFAEFLGSPEPAAAEVLPAEPDPNVYAARLIDLARPRLDWMAARPAEWWLEKTRFFDVDRQRIWVFWRRVLHSAHHRTQLTVCQRLLERPVLSTYGPTADVTWQGADPTLTAGT